MPDPVLFIGNQKYSSWSLRPWIAMKVKDVAFEQKLMRFDDHPERVDFRSFSDSGTVPALHHGDLRISEFAGDPRISGRYPS